MLGEVSFCTMTLPNCLRNGAKELLLYLLFHSIDVIKYKEHDYYTIITVKANRKKVGLNAFANRTFILNNKIPLKWFNMTLETFKIHCKKEFLCL